MLMDNLPYGDFEMQFHDGTLLRNSIDKRELSIRLPHGEVHVINTGTGEKLNFKSHLLPLFRHLQESLKICLDLEKSALSSLSKGKRIKFPIVIRHSQTQDSMPPTIMTGTSQSTFPSYTGKMTSLLSTLSSLHPVSKSQQPPARQLHKVHDLSIVHSGIMSSTDWNREFRGSNRIIETGLPKLIDRVSESLSKKQNNNLSQLSSQQISMMSTITTAAAATAAITTTATNTNTPTTNTTTATGSIYAIHNAMIALDIRKTCFLSGIGWCLQADNEDLLVLFVDGIELIIDNRSRSLHFVHNGDIRRYNIDTSLPETLKTKLIYLPEFMKLLGIVSH